MRSYDDATRKMLLDGIERIAKAQAEAFGAPAPEIKVEQDYTPSLFNNADLADKAMAAIADTIGKDNVKEVPPVMGGEDFAFMLEQVPGCYVWIGNGMGEHRDAGHGLGPCMLHNGSYDFNDDLLPLGATYWVRIVEQWFAKNS